MALLGRVPERRLPYYVHTDGAVFVTPDLHYLHAFYTILAGGRDQKSRPADLDQKSGCLRAADGKQLVFLQKVMIGENTVGVPASSKLGLVDEIDGEKIYSLNQLAHLLEGKTEDCIVRLSSGAELALSCISEAGSAWLTSKHSISKRMSDSVAAYLAFEGKIPEMRAMLKEEIQGFNRARLRDVGTDAYTPEMPYACRGGVGLFLFNLMQTQLVASAGRGTTHRLMLLDTAETDVTVTEMPPAIDLLNAAFRWNAAFLLTLFRAPAFSLFSAPIGAAMGSDECTAMIPFQASATVRTTGITGIFFDISPSGRFHLKIKGAGGQVLELTNGFA